MSVSFSILFGTQLTERGGCSLLWGTPRIGSEPTASSTAAMQRLDKLLWVGKKGALPTGDLEWLHTEPLASSTSRPVWRGHAVVGTDDVRAGHVRPRAE
jgi:hypothetical protein